MLTIGAPTARAPRPPEAPMTLTPQFGLDRIGQIAINVRDLARATAFYRDTLGMRFLFEFPGLAFFDCGGVRLIMAVPESPDFDHPTSVLYYAVADLAGAHATLVERGVAFEREPHLIATLADREVWM